MSAVWWWMINFRLSMSFHTSLVVTRPVLSTGVKAQSLRVLLRDSGSGSIGTRGWKSSTEMLVGFSPVSVGGGSGPPVCGSTIGTRLAHARHTTTSSVYRISRYRMDRNFCFLPYSTSGLMWCRDLPKRTANKLLRLIFP
ncbi:unnamed protein product [Penicillium salamii]|uniref:Secreted protein n=1 Tax=Penicillium salamii TaxID=1612424 RepID=A0A9W4MXR1_9EURO|nr:unnamed protein product [Penicillium salamii]CAG8218816.1 unnamed protein product [Penicillium salamii]CAG8222043.1 unnamed protein product [Penicillium salamii]CAG8336146.1 unnamed protein product [Penicillium salamii]CAG8392904.1 unnamed protein product [Penicillium salamii]